MVCSLAAVRCTAFETIVLARSVGLLVHEDAVLGLGYQHAPVGA
jgi:hypothetical protein